MNWILLAYYLSKEAVTALMMFYKNTKEMVPSSEGDADIIAWVL